MAAVLDLEPDLAIGGAVVVDEDTLALPDVEAGVGVRARGDVAPQAAVRRAHGKHRIGEVPPRGVVAEAEAIDARQVDAETGEPLHREAAQLEPLEAPAALAARGQLVVGRIERVGRRDPDPVRLGARLLEHDWLLAVPGGHELDAVPGDGERPRRARLVIRAGLDLDRRTRRGGVDRGLDRHPGTHRDLRRGRDDAAAG